MSSKPTGSPQEVEKNSGKTWAHNSPDLRRTLQRKIAAEKRRTQLVANLKQFLAKNSSEGRPKQEPISTSDLRQTLKRKSCGKSQEDLVPRKQKYTSLTRTISNPSFSGLGIKSEAPAIQPIEVRGRKGDFLISTSLAESEKRSDDDRYEVEITRTVANPSFSESGTTYPARQDTKAKSAEVRGSKRELLISTSPAEIEKRNDDDSSEVEITRTVSNPTFFGKGITHQASQVTKPKVPAVQQTGVIGRKGELLISTSPAKTKKRRDDDSSEVEIIDVRELENDCNDIEILDEINPSIYKLNSDLESTSNASQLGNDLEDQVLEVRGRKNEINSSNYNPNSGLEPTTNASQLGNDPEGQILEVSGSKNEITSSNYYRNYYRNSDLESRSNASQIGNYPQGQTLEVRGNYPQGQILEVRGRKNEINSSNYNPNLCLEPTSNASQLGNDPEGQILEVRGRKNEINPSNYNPNPGLEPISNASQLGNDQEGHILEVRGRENEINSSNYNLNSDLESTSHASQLGNDPEGQILEVRGRKNEIDSVSYKPNSGLVPTSRANQLGNDPDLQILKVRGRENEINPSNYNPNSDVEPTSHASQLGNDPDGQILEVRGRQNEINPSNYNPNSGVDPTSHASQLENDSDGQILEVRGRQNEINSSNCNPICGLEPTCHASQLGNSPMGQILEVRGRKRESFLICRDNMVAAPDKPEETRDDNSIAIDGQLNTNDFVEPNSVHLTAFKKADTDPALPPPYNPSVPPPSFSSVSINLPTQIQPFQPTIFNIQLASNSNESVTSEGNASFNPVSNPPPPISNTLPQIPNPLPDMTNLPPQMTNPLPQISNPLPQISNPPPNMATPPPPQISNLPPSMSIPPPRMSIVLPQIFNPASSTSSNPANSSSSAPSTSGPTMFCYDSDKQKQTGLRPIVIDGCNVAVSHGTNSGRRSFSVKGIDICIQFFKKRGHSTILVFLPEYRRGEDYELLSKLEQDGHIVFTPSRRIGNKTVTSYDDNYIIGYAKETGGIIVSKDQYRDVIQQKPEWKTTVEQQLLIPAWAGDLVMFPQDPLGQDGPTLDQFLKF